MRRTNKFYNSKFYFCWIASRHWNLGGDNLILSGIGEWGMKKWKKGDIYSIVPLKENMPESIWKGDKVDKELK